ncbi:hypothetical protein TNCV_3373071 [Trichonephila clavipes]|nr:hypothetical protein TNCV_3373071 [Trichonephila clavipes]
MYLRRTGVEARKPITTAALKKCEYRLRRTTGVYFLRIVRKKKKGASNSRKNIALTAKEIESSFSPKKRISESHTSKMEAKNENKIKQEENLDADEEKIKQHIIIIKNDIRFEDLQTFFQKYNLEIPIQTFIRNFESTCDSFDIPEKQKILFITKLVDGAVKTYIKSKSIPKSFYELEK